MQGDILLAILFIFYLARCLGKETQTYLNKMIFAPKYADDITYATNNKRIYDQIAEKTSRKLKTFNLTVNETKTEKYQVPKPPPPPKPIMEELLAHKHDKFLWSELDWLVNYHPPIIDNTSDYKKCKLLGSLIDTEADIKRRKVLTIDAMRKCNAIFKSSRISIKLKIRFFEAYTSSVFLYNSELWYANKTLNDEINAFHRKQLRYSLNIHYPKVITNENLYEMTQVKPWSEIIKSRRLKWLGHVMRLEKETPARLSINEVFPDFGDGIIAFDSDALASEALVFMLVGLQGHWKYPAGYVLYNKLDANNLHCLVSKTLDLAIEHKLNIHSVTCDGTWSNVSAMKLLGCKAGKHIDEIDG